MILHYFKLVWAKRKIYALVLMTLCIAFVLISFFGTMLHREALPLLYPSGMESEDNYRVLVSMYSQDAQQADTTQNFLYRVGKLAEVIRRHPQIEAVSTSPAMPFQGHYHQSFYQDQEIYVSTVDYGFYQVFSPKILMGSWFSPEEPSNAMPGIILSQKLSTSLFGRQNPLGKVMNLEDASFSFRGNTFTHAHEGSESEKNPYKVIGVVNDLRFQLGGRTRPTALVLDPTPREMNWDNLSRSHIVIRSTRFQDSEDLRKALTQILESQTPGPQEQPLVINEVIPFEKIHKGSLNEFLFALILGGFIAIILLSNVAIGIFGVFWQNVLRRFNELGIRRAMGSTRQKIIRLIFGEALALTSLAFIPGIAIYSQFIIFNYVGATWEHGIPAMLFAAGFLLLLVSGCALYPSILASSIQPADALREE